MKYDWIKTYSQTMPTGSAHYYRLHHDGEYVYEIFPIGTSKKRIWHLYISNRKYTPVIIKKKESTFKDAKARAIRILHAIEGEGE